MIWDIIIVVGVVWIFMSFLSFLQSIYIKNIYKELEALGETFYGRNAGFLRMSLLVFTAVDASGKVLAAKKMRTARIVIPPKIFAFDELKGRNINSLSKSEDEFDEKTLRALDSLFSSYQSSKGRK